MNIYQKISSLTDVFDEYTEIIFYEENGEKKYRVDLVEDAPQYVIDAFKEAKKLLSSPEYLPIR